jgi:hypothetical protein
MSGKRINRVSFGAAALIDVAKTAIAHNSERTIVMNPPMPIDGRPDGRVAGAMNIILR